MAAADTTARSSASLPAVLVPLAAVACALAAIAFTYAAAVPLAAAGAALAGLLFAGHGQGLRRNAVSILALPLVVAGLGLMATSGLEPWQIPKSWLELLQIRPLSAALLCGLHLSYCGYRMLQARATLPLRSQLPVLVLPPLFNGLLALSSTGLMAALGAAAGIDAASALAGRVLVLGAFNEIVLLGVGLLMDRRGSWHWKTHALVLGASIWVATTPLLADLADHAALSGLPWLLHGFVAIPLAALSQSGLWAETFLITGLLLDALHGRRPTREACFMHFRSGLLRGAIYAALFMLVVILLAGLASIPWLVAVVQSVPPLAGLVLGSLAFPLAKTIIESFDGSSPFHRRMVAALSDPMNYVRGATAGAGLGLAVETSWTGATPLDRFLMGCAIGAATYGGVDLLGDLLDILRRRRRVLQSWRIYAFGALLGAFVGGSLAWYFDAAQLQAVVTKLGRYAALDFESAGLTAQAYLVYPLFSKWGAIDLGTVAGGVKLLYAESLSGVINWSLAAPLFSINLVALKALFDRSWSPLRNLVSAQGLAGLVEQTVRVLRWGLWMAPVIYSFLRLAPDPSWYNQDGAIRSLAAMLQSILLSPGDFRAWSLSVFLGLLAYDGLRVLIWFDHMGLRVATLVNLSFVGGDALDEKAARWLGYSARTRVIPEGIRRFLTWAPLLIPFYIPRGAEWDQVWGQAETLASSGASVPPAVLGVLVAYRIAAVVALVGALWLLRRGWRRWRAGRAAEAAAPPFVIGNGRYFVELAADGRGYSRCESEVRPGFILDLTRRPDDPMSLRGKFLYLREFDSDGRQVGQGWSLTQEPLRYGVCAVTQPSPTRLAIVRAQAGFRIEARIEVAASEPVETWDIRIQNTGEHARILELTSYQELAVGAVDSYRRNPAFAGMHVGTVFVRSLGAILARNRLMRVDASEPAAARMSHEVGFHAVGGDASLTGFQDSRSAFIGRGTLRAPEAPMQPLEHEGLHYSFDPCASLQLRMELGPGETRRLRFVDGYAQDELAAARRIAGFLGVPQPRSQEMRFLFESPRRHAGGEDETLRGWARPWSEDGTELRAPTDARRPWPHLIANPQGHGALLSSDGAVCAFAGNAQQNALSSACLDSLPTQQPSEVFLLRDCDSGQILSPGLVPTRLPDAARECVFGLGFARFSQRLQGLELQLEVLVDVDHPAQYRVLSIRNHGETPRRLRLMSSVEMILAEVGQDSCGRLQSEQVRAEPGSDVLLFRNPHNDFQRGWAFAACSIAEATGHTERCPVFGAARDPAQPFLLLQGVTDARQADDGWRCAAFCAEIELAPGACHESLIVLGQTQTRESAIELGIQLRDPRQLPRARQRIRQFWEERLGVLQLQTGHPDFDRLVNTWLPYQVLVSRLWGRTGPSQRGGAYGYRDQLQDVLPLTLLDPEQARRQILLHAAQQFREGDVLKWWHPSWEGRTGVGVRTHASDPHLWLPYVLVRYLQATGDHGVLDERLPFLEGQPVPPGQEGYFLALRRARDRATLYEHCRRAIDLSLERRSARGVPLIGSGDWNDGLDMLGLKMKGESTWMTFFLHEVLTSFAAVAEARKDGDRAARYRDEASRLRRIADTLWRPGGYVRASSDEGIELVYADALTASWAVLSGCADLDRGIAALEAGLERLEKDSRVLLMSPAFDETSLPYPGRIAEYPPGVRENAGQYSHGVSWLVDAWLRCAQLADEQGRSAQAASCRARAAQLWLKISPVSRSTADELPRYGLPPHQQPADVYDGPGHAGRGGWTWYTGAAARMLSAAYELAGLRIHRYKLELAPGTSGPLAARKVCFRGRRLERDEGLEDPRIDVGAPVQREEPSAAFVREDGQSP